MTAEADYQPADAQIEGRFNKIGTSPKRRKPRTREVMRGFQDGTLGEGEGVCRQADVWSAHGFKILAQACQLK